MSIKHPMDVFLSYNRFDNVVVGIIMTNYKVNKQFIKKWNFKLEQKIPFTIFYYTILMVYIECRSVFIILLRCIIMPIFLFKHFYLITLIPTLV